MRTFIAKDEENIFSYHGSHDFLCQIEVIQGSLNFYSKNGYGVSQTNYDEKLECNVTSKCSFTKTFNSTFEYLSNVILIVGKHET